MHFDLYYSFLIKQKSRFNVLCKTVVELELGRRKFPWVSFVLATGNEYLLAVLCCDAILSHRAHTGVHWNILKQVGLGLEPWNQSAENCPHFNHKIPKIGSKFMIYVSVTEGHKKQKKKKSLTSSDEFGCILVHIRIQITLLQYWSYICLTVLKWVT